MEERPFCPLCGQPPGSRAFEIGYDDERVLQFLDRFYWNRVNEAYLREEQFVIEHCEDCDFYWHRYVLGDEGMEVLYESWIPAWVSWMKDDDWRKRERNIQRASKFVQWFDQRPSTVSVLDYGMGWGSFLDAMGAYGCELHGYEISEPRKRHAGENGILVHEDWETLKNREFNLVYANQVLEHVPNPGETLDLLSELVAEGGLCYIGVPTAGAEPTVEHVLQKGPYQPLTHVNGFPSDTLVEEMSARGLEVVHLPRTMLPVSIVGAAQFITKQVLKRAGILNSVLRTSAFTFGKPA